MMQKTMIASVVVIIALLALAGCSKSQPTTKDTPAEAVVADPATDSDLTTIQSDIAGLDADSTSTDDLSTVEQDISDVEALPIQ